MKSWKLLLICSVFLYTPIGVSADVYSTSVSITSSFTKPIISLWNSVVNTYADALTPIFTVQTQTASVASTGTPPSDISTGTPAPAPKVTNSVSSTPSPTFLQTLASLAQRVSTLENRATVSSSLTLSNYITKEELEAALQSIPRTIYNTTSYGGSSSYSIPPPNMASIALVTSEIASLNTTLTTQIDVLSAVQASTTSSQWSTLGSDISYTTGNVGIGTTTPAYKLDVNGDINISAGSYFKYNGANFAMASTTKFNYFTGGAGNLTMTGQGNTAQGYLALSSNTTSPHNIAFGREALKSHSNGANNVALGAYALTSDLNGINNIGIGTAAMQAHTTGDLNTVTGAYSFYYDTNGSGNTGYGSGVGYNANSDLVQYRINGDTYMTLIGTGATKNNASALTNGTAIGYGAHVLESNQVVLGNDSVTTTLLKGNVGIGTFAPTQALEIAANGRLRIGDGYQNGISPTPTFTWDIYREGNVGLLTFYGNQSGADGVIFSGAGGEKMRITPSGNVGIGTTNPQYKLDIGNNSDETVRIGINANSGHSGSLLFGSPNLAAASKISGIYGGAYDGSLSFSTQAAGVDGSDRMTERVRIDNAGNVGIGTTTPSSKLTVAGDINFTGNLLKNGADAMAFTASSTTYSIYSSFGAVPTGQNNFLVGRNAGAGATVSGSNNVYIGYSAAYYGGVGSNNNYLGSSAGSNSAGSGNNFLGSQAGAYAGGSNNNFLGAAAGLISAGSYNNFFGENSGRNNTSGSYNNFFGENSGRSNTSGSYNNFFGASSGFSNITGSNNIFIGRNAGYTDGTITTPSNLTNAIAIGYNAQVSTSSSLILGGTGAYAVNVGIGTTNPGSKLSIVGGDLMIGQGELDRKINFFGSGYGIGLSSGSGFPMEFFSSTNNYTFGGSTGVSISGSTIGAGIETPRSPFDSVSAVSQYPTIKDFYSMGYNTSYKTSIGASFDGGVDNQNLFVVRVSKAGASGVTDTAVFTGAGNVGIGTTTPSAQLTTTGTVQFANFGAGSLQTDANGNVTVSSDENLKDIQGTFASGLASLDLLSPITYKWKASTGYDTNNSYTGFSAQNVQLAIPEAVTVDKNGFLTLSDRPILATLVNAVKEIASLSGEFKNRMVAWLGDAGNGIQNFFAKKVTTEELCLGTDGADKVCVTKEQLRILLQNAGQSVTAGSDISGNTSNGDSGGSSNTITTTTSDTTTSSSTSDTSTTETPSTDPVVEPTPEVISTPEPTPVTEPTLDPAPAPTPVPESISEPVDL